MNRSGKDKDPDELDELALALVRRLWRDTNVLALDAACGLGGQAVRLAKAGAQVVAFDSADLSAEVQARAVEARVADRITFYQGDLRRGGDILRDRRFHVICCQRAIHYLRWSDAVTVVRNFTQLLHPGGKLFLSACGLYSELRDGYPWLEARETRYAPLSESMRAKHGIQGDICLYTEDDLAELFREGGLSKETIFRSRFGNVKGVAVKEFGRQP
ncbi:class I SAM-dependent methyltransferase [Geomonas sp. RF6]|uniref:class I SAM-dependent methyltransferase n=1 Tax=Geomonas sp. RF6 TaxID=2897342 RepID=UPI001E34BF44|nr:class I SAM-dependent methyltransferase [Geomonas sp. RF6]UFS70229.1 class I SAM-dependent methyltransferase [Geomonas sp. RF6]